MKECLTLLLTACLLVSVACSYIPVIVEESGTDDVEKFSTVVHFFLVVTNNGADYVQVTVAPIECCLIITNHDIDCNVIELKPPVNLTLGHRHSGDNWGRAVFMFRNLYARYRQGNCSFEISTKDVSFSHTLIFDTSPEGEDVNECFGMDQDPDRGCAPVDCAIKYKGHRNFYRNSTGNCEAVVHCDTRGPDGVEIVAYYDWDTNACHRLDFEENSLSEIESILESPVDIDPSQSKYFPSLEAEHLKQIAEGGDEVLECNQGVQNGAYCECNEGWLSSGIHEADPLTYHWCDEEEMMNIGGTIQYAPVRLPKPLEGFIIFLLTVLNIGLTLLWVYLAYRLFLKERCDRACTKNPSYTLLEPKLN